MPRNRAKRGAKTAGAMSEDVPLFPRRRTGGEWVEVATLPHRQQAMPRNRALRGAKNSRSDERGCSSVHPPPNRRRMGGGSNPAPPPTGYAAQSRKAQCKKQPERRALRPQARFGAQPPQAALGAEIGCSSVLPPPKGGDWVEAWALPYHKQAMPLSLAQPRALRQQPRMMQYTISYRG